MRNSRAITVIIAVSIVGIAVLINWISSTVPLRVNIDPNRFVKTDLVVTTSKDGHRKVHDLPYRTRVKPGSYTVSAWGKGASVVTDSIIAEEGSNNTLVLKFEKSSGENLANLYREAPKEIEYKKLFPYETADFLITAEDDGEKIVSITISAKHRFSLPSETEAYAEEREIVVAGAKKWLKDQDIPPDIAIKIVDI